MELDVNHQHQQEAGWHHGFTSDVTYRFALLDLLFDLILPAGLCFHLGGVLVLQLVGLRLYPLPAQVPSNGVSSNPTAGVGSTPGGLGGEQTKEIAISPPALGKVSVPDWLAGGVMFRCRAWDWFLGLHTGAHRGAGSHQLAPLTAPSKDLPVPIQVPRHLQPLQRVQGAKLGAVPPSVGPETLAEGSTGVLYRSAATSASFPSNVSSSPSFAA